MDVAVLLTFCWGTELSASSVARMVWIRQEYRDNCPVQAWAAWSGLAGQNQSNVIGLFFGADPGIEG
jgi:hypothetical protein